MMMCMRSFFLPCAFPDPLNKPVNGQFDQSGIVYALAFGIHSSSLFR